jgi:Putative cyclase
MSGSSSTATATASPRWCSTTVTAPASTSSDQFDYRDGKEIARGEHVGAQALGVENMATACVQGRAVLIDLEAHFGRARTIVGYDTLMRVLDQDGVAVEDGDFVCLRTGFDEVILAMGGRRTSGCIIPAPRSTAGTRGCSNG